MQQNITASEEVQAPEGVYRPMSAAERIACNTAALALILNRRLPIRRAMLRSLVSDMREAHRDLLPLLADGQRWRGAA